MSRVGLVATTTTCCSRRMPLGQLDALDRLEAGVDDSGNREGVVPDLLADQNAAVVNRSGTHPVSE